MNKPSFQRPARVRRTVLAALVAACCGSAGGAPTQPVVVAGQATFAQQGNVFSITNTPNTIINWQSFSIGAGEITRFIQQNADSAVLNRILGQDPSKILGALQSNGQVFLINPNGVMFGRDARIDVQGLTASTLDLGNADFLAGKRNFKAGAAAGQISNEGNLTAAAGGHIFLVAPDIENKGIITAPNGQVVLAAGHSVTLVDSGNPDLHVVVTAAGDQAVNLGQVIAHGGKVGIYGALVRQKGVVNADSAQMGANGKIVFKSSGDTLLEAGSTTSATGAGKGGSVSVLGERVALTGNASVDVSGATGGGTVLMGGDYRGQNAGVQNAKQAWLGKDALIRADATVSGNGGKVIVWSDDITRAYGSISARGGTAGGDGGLVETSGHVLETYGARVDTGATKGQLGRWLLDPLNIIVATGGAADLTEVSLFANNPAGTSTIDPATLAAATANVTLEASDSITFTDAATIGNGKSLTATALVDMNVNAAIYTTGSGAISLTAGDANCDCNGLTIGANGSVTTAGGNITMASQGITVHGGVNAGAGNIVINSEYGVTINGTLAAKNLTIASDYTINMSGSMTAGSGGLVTLSAPDLTMGALGAISGASTTINADGLSLLGTVNAGGGTVAISPYTSSVNVQLGAGAADVASTSLGLTDTELGQISNAAAINLGTSTADTSVVGALDLSTVVPSGKTLTLTSGGDLDINGALTVAGTLALAAPAGTISQSGIITAPKLKVVGATVALTAANAVTDLAGSATVTFDFKSVNPLNITSVASVNGVTAPTYMTLYGNGISSTGSNLVTAETLSLVSTAGIGSSGAPLKTNVDDMDVAAVGASGIYINNAAALILNRADVTGGTGGVSVTSTGGLTVPATWGDGYTGGVVTAGGAINLTTYSPMSLIGEIDSAGGSVALSAPGGTITVGAGGVDTSSGVGSININATTVVNSGGLTTSSGAISVTGDTVTNAGPMTTVTGPVAVTAYTFNNNGTITSTSGNVTITADAVIGTGTITTSGVTSQLVRTVPPATVAECVANPNVSPDCASIVQTAFNACLVNPSGPDCALVLPSLATCTAAPTTAGCSVVLPSLATCTTAPTTPGCSVVLPSLATCIAAPSTAGCTAVLPSLTSCIADPTAAGCSAVLPSIATCTAAPTTPGCSVVLPSMAVCLATPSAPGCVNVLPSLSTCIAAPTTLGCAVVLPTLAVCVSAPATPGCSVVLPTLSQCIAAPTLAGCSVVLPTLTQCIASPTLDGCSVVLPTIAACVALPSAPGCAAVLPSLSQCVATPVMPGCSVVLPTLAQCVATPTLQGCSVVIPTVDNCVLNPTLPACVVVVPPTTSTPDAPIAQALNNTVNVINNVALVQNTAYTPTDAAPKPGAGTGSAGGASDGVKNEEKKEDAKTDGTTNKTGVKNEPAKKMYCN